MSKIPFVRPFVTGNELSYVQNCLENRHLSGDGIYTKKCAAWFEDRLQATKVLMTHSCTAALEMAALLIDLKPGDEVIMPSFTFVSTANAVVLRGATPVFVDIRRDTLNLDETKVEEAITSKTKAIFPVHYAGVACEMDTILAIAKKANLYVVEDAAQGFGSKYKGRPLGSIGHLGALSFHETKNIVSGEGGALVLRDPQFQARAEILREKGTNRSAFYRGEVDKYTWIDLGSSYLPSDILMACLWAQLEMSQQIQSQRIKIWDYYHSALESLEAKGALKRPSIPADCEANGHIYYVTLPSTEIRDKAMASLKKEFGISTTFHYVPLHSAPAGRKFGRAVGPMSITEDLSHRLLRLPLWPELENPERVVEGLSRLLKA